MARTFTVPDHPITPRTDSVSLALGKRLAMVRGCADCHGADLGGSVMIDDPALGRLAPPNLTLGGRGAELEPRDWERAVRHAVRRDGSPLRVMPANEFTTMADDELGAIIGYARSLPPVTKPPVASKMGPIIRALFLSGQVTLLPAEVIDHTAPHLAHVDAEPTAKYGKYLAAGCTGCHGPTLSGGKIPGGPPDWPPAANITPGEGSAMSRYPSAGHFTTMLRSGKRPDGTPIKVMPFGSLAKLSDVDAQAVYEFLKTVPARPAGGR